MERLIVNLDKSSLPYKEVISKGFVPKGDIFTAPLYDFSSTKIEEIKFMLKFSPLAVYAEEGFIGLILSDSLILYTTKGNKTLDFYGNFTNVIFRQVYYGYNSSNMPVFLDIIKNNCEFASPDRMYFEMIYGAEFYRFITENNMGFSKAPLSAQLFDRSILDEDRVFYDRFGISIEQFNKRLRSAG